MKKKFFVALLAIFLFPALLSACKKLPGSSDSLTNVTLNEVAHSIFYAPLYVAIEEGYFAEGGIRLTLVTGFGADKTLTALLTGEADIGFMGSESTIYAYTGGSQDYVVNFAQLTQRAGNFLVSREPIADFSWNILKGSNVLGGRPGGMPQMVFEYILKKNSIDPKADLSIDQSIDFGSTAAAFSGGQGDFTVEFEPHATALEKKGDGYVVASLGEDSGYVPYTAFSARKSYLESHKEVVQSFTDALQKGMDYVRSHAPEEIAKVIAPQFDGTDPDTLAAIVTRYHEQDTWKENLIFQEDSFTLLQNILEEAGVLETRVPYENLVTTEFAEKAAR
ncbi:MAG: ABC transporter substrate-binding protein [Clostridium sp.]|nr:ABC transporter substrate-binding protein [Clostridium sp.]